ncbi:hypothetical protein [Ekhidna sp.]|uniref:hypothetical protein n=1 Tax=Ekhidna sp. TaxID=2608089 RepID=UPI00351450AC
MTNRKRNTMTMLEYCKVLLSKLSFSPELIEKEYKKALKYLSPNDQTELKRWLRTNRTKIH